MNKELEDLKNEVEELRAYKAKWDKSYPGLTPNGVKNMEQQLYQLYKERDEAGEALANNYQTNLENSSN